jgi:hypothetical protein
VETDGGQQLRSCVSCGNIQFVIEENVCTADSIQHSDEFIFTSFSLTFCFSHHQAVPYGLEKYNNTVFSSLLPYG